MPDRPRIVVFTTLFPNTTQPNSGIFIRERMFRVAKELPLMVVAPIPWFPFQGLIRIFRPHFRPAPPYREIQDGIEVLHPRFFSIPGIGKSLDGVFLALSTIVLMQQLQRKHNFNIIDSHFAYPDGYAASLLGKWLRLPFTVTLRGTEARLARQSVFRKHITSALQSATIVFSVSDSLRQIALTLGIPESKTQVVGNGIDTTKFYAIDKLSARTKFGLPANARVLVSVGGLVERKGFHRVINCLPKLIQEFPTLHYLIVGGPSPEGDMGSQLRAQVTELGLNDHVVFTGPMKSEALKEPLSAADVFVLSTRNEGWANVFLEAMACGLPVITTDVGGNAEVVCHPELGTIIPFDDQTVLENALAAALKQKWDRNKIIAYAQDNTWDSRVAILIKAFKDITSHINNRRPVAHSASQLKESETCR
jgi:glycosyltransferase involved in cell wall biosynthesis